MSITQTKERGARERVRVSRFAWRLSAEWKSLGLPVSDAPVVVAVSGGADSAALITALNELLKAGRLNATLIVAHFDHGLRIEAGREDALWVERFAAESRLQFELGRGDVRRLAESAGDNLEQAARRARYEFLAGAAEKCGARLILTGHTRDDQAETVLLRLMRGSGAEGLSGIEPVRALFAGSDVMLARPLLRWARRAETEEYCREHEVEFRLDAMNEDEGFARVRVRRRLLPLMETFNRRIVESLARSSHLLREDSEVLNSLAEELLRAACEKDMASEGKSGALDVNILMGAHRALRRRALRLWIARGRGDLRRLELVHLAGVEKLLEGERGGRVVELPGGAYVERRGKRLFLSIKSHSERTR